MAIHGKQLRDATINLEKLQGIPAGLTADKLLLSGSNGALAAPDYDLDADIEFTVSGQTLSVDVKADAIGMTELDAAIIASTLGTDHSTLPTSQAVRNYVDTQVTGQDLDFTTDSGSGAVDLDSQSLEIAGGTGIASSATGQTVKISIDSTVVTLADTQTLTDKTLTSPVLDGTVSGAAIKDEDDMLSDSATHLATQQSIKAYVDAQVSASGSALELTAGTGSASIGLASETLTVVGGANISTAATLNSLTVSLDDHISLATATLSGTLSVGGNAVITGDLTVNGTTTTVNSTTVTVDDKNLELGSVANPTDAIADGGGITLKGTSDKTFSWVDLTDAWTSSENMDLASGKSYRIAGSEVLSANGAIKVDSGVAGSGLEHIPATGALSLAYDNDSIKLDANGDAYAAALEETQLNVVLTSLGSPISSASGYTTVDLAYTPASDSAVLLFLNGVLTKLGTSTSDAFFFSGSGNNGSSAKAINKLAQGDELWFNPTAAGFSLDSTDEISITYQHARNR